MDQDRGRRPGMGGKDEEAEAPVTRLERLEKAAASGMRKHLGTAKEPTMLQAVARPTQLVGQTIHAHDHEAKEQAPMDMLAGKTQVAMAMASHIKGVTTRNFSKGYLEAREEAKSRAAATVRIPKSDIADPKVGDQLTRDIQHLAANAKLALDPKKPMSPELVKARLETAKRWPGDNVTFLMDNVGLKRNPELAKHLSNYARGGRDKLVEAGLLPPLEMASERNNGRDRQPGTGLEPAASANQARGGGINEAMRKGDEFRKLGPVQQRALPARRRDTGPEL